MFFHSFREKKLPKHFAVSGIYYTFAEKLQLYGDK